MPSRIFKDRICSIFRTVLPTCARLLFGMSPTLCSFAAIRATWLCLKRSQAGMLALSAHTKASPPCSIAQEVRSAHQAASARTTDLATRLQRIRASRARWGRQCSPRDFCNNLAMIQAELGWNIGPACMYDAKPTLHYCPGGEVSPSGSKCRGYRTCDPHARLLSQFCPSGK